jgi:hypothetical protein
MSRRLTTALLAGAITLAGGAACATPSGSKGADASVQRALTRHPSAGYATTSTGTAPCGWERKAAYRHVIWIWMENRSYQQVLGSGSGHLASFARQCGTATNYDAITHPSLPNYIAATSGSTHGIGSDCDPGSCPVRGQSLYGQLDAKGAGGWAGFAEAMAHPCDRASYGKYAARHNPAVYYTALRASCRRHDLSMGGTQGRFARRLSAARLPAFTFITPNLCDDGHDCATSTADSWLGYWLHRLTGSGLYRAGHTAIFVTWDEGTTSSNQVATVVIAPTVPKHTRAHTHFTHYSLLRTTEELLGLRRLGHAATARSMRTAFHL